VGVEGTSLVLLSPFFDHKSIKITTFVEFNRLAQSQIEQEKPRVYTILATKLKIRSVPVSLFGNKTHDKVSTQAKRVRSL
jgi:hypothetical protein